MVDLVVLEESTPPPPDVVDAAETEADTAVKKRGRKRKRSLFSGKMSREEREGLVSGYRKELESLSAYMKDFMNGKVVLDGDGSLPLINRVACMVVESGLPYKKLVQEVYQRLEKEDGVTVDSVRRDVLKVGERMMYGVEKKDADVLADESDSCIWCWETRDFNLLPMSQRGMFRMRYRCRKKIHERIIALIGIIAALSEEELHVDDNTKILRASENLGKALDESQLRSLAASLLQKNKAELSEKEAKTKEKELIKELERNKKDAEKKKKIMERELLKEKLQCEKEQKKLQDEADKEKRRETESKKLLKKQAETAEKEQKRREKEEAELKKKLAVQKQASMMERFFKKSKENTVIQENASLSPSSHLPEQTEGANDAVTYLMDSILSGIHASDFSNILRSHLSVWRIQCNKFQNWGIRRKPKVPQIKELKLLGSPFESVPVSKVSNRTVNFEQKADDDLWEDANYDCTPPCLEINSNHFRLCRRRKKLLQFDKSHRPAFYGTMSRKSDVVGPRCPLKKDPNLDYEIDSDEEWEEEDPGESLSDCDKDEDESLNEEKVVHEDEDASEDSFMVPDGYLSEDEGVEMVREDADDNCKSTPCNGIQEAENEIIRGILQYQATLNKLTDRVIKGKTTPLIILNFTHEKSSSTLINDLSGNPKREQMCLLALSIQSCYEGACVLPSTGCESSINNEEYACNLACQNNSTGPQLKATALMDSDLPKIVQCVRTGAGGMSKILELLQQSFPTVPKKQLKRKVREIADFVDNKWQVKNEILNRAGVSPSPENGNLKTNRISMFFSKRCLPSSGETINLDASSPQTKKLKADEPPVLERCSVNYIGDDECTLLNYIPKSSPLNVSPEI